MKYIAVYYPDSKNDRTKGGFDTEDQAWEYVLKNLCSVCEEDGIESACAAEWEVHTEEYWESL